MAISNFVSYALSLIAWAIILLAPTLWIILGVYVYNDAKKRGMNKILWTIVAMIAPSFLGFIVYLLVRKKYYDLACDVCGALVSEDFIACPNCGATLKAKCPNCSAPVKEDWSVCPQCAQALPQSYGDIRPPVSVKFDNANLRKALTVVVICYVLCVIAPFLLCVFPLP